MTAATDLVKTSKDALDNSAEKNRNLFIAVNLFLATLLVLVLSITDYELLILSKPLQLPLVNVGLPLMVFSLTACLFVLALHFVLLYNLVEHRDKLDAWMLASKNAGLTPATTELFPSLFDFTYLRWHTHQMGRELIFFSWFAYVVLPLGVMATILICFADLQMAWLTSWHSVFVVLDLLVIGLYWWRPHYFKAQPQVQTQAQAPRKTTWRDGLLVGLIGLMMVTLLSYLLWIVFMFWVVQWAISHPSTTQEAFNKSLAKRVLDVEETDFGGAIKWLPRLEVPRKRVTQLNEDFFKLYKTQNDPDKKKLMKEENYVELMAGLTVNPEPDLSDRKFAFANFSRSEFQGLNLTHTVFYGAYLEQTFLDNTLARGGLQDNDFLGVSGQFSYQNKKQTADQLFARTTQTTAPAIAQAKTIDTPESSRSNTADAAGKLIANRYQVLGNGSEIKDTQTKLIWQRCSVGQNWNARNCEGEAKRFTFGEAQQLAGKGWRLPTVRELFGLVSCSSGQIGQYTDDVEDGGLPIKNGCLGSYTRPTINTDAFPNTVAFWYWTASPYVGNSSGAWGVGFDDGGVYGYGRGYDYRVRLVRASQ